jgi:uncharacterized protein YkwD
MRLFNSGDRPAGAARGRRAGAASLAALIAMASLGALPAGAHGTRHASPRQHGTRSCVNANATVAGTSTSALRSAVVCLINQQRARRGLPALRQSWRLDRSAQGWTNQMVATHSFTHGSAFADRISAAGFTWQAAGENIATGFPTPAAVVSAWMASTDHCTNILSPQYSYVGTGVNRRWVAPYGTGPATWTQDFALPMGAHAPSSNTGPARGCPYA